MLCCPHVKQKLLPQFTPIFHIHNRWCHQMIRLLPCESLNRWTVGMHTDHICLNCFFHQPINLLITFIITCKCSIRLICTADCMSCKITHLTIFRLLNSNISSCKIGKFHSACFPFIVLPDNISNTRIQIYPAFCHLVYITILRKFLGRVKMNFIPGFSFYFKL